MSLGAVKRHGGQIEEGMEKEMRGGGRNNRSQGTSPWASLALLLMKLPFSCWSVFSISPFCFHSLKARWKTNAEIMAMERLKEKCWRPI